MTDLLIVGAGIAGSVAALRAAEAGAEVLLVHSSEAATTWAQGGIVYRGASDPDALIQDILQAGGEKNYRPAVELVARQGPIVVDEWLRERLGVKFDVGLDGNPDLSLEAAHNSRRILHVRDTTGAAISQKCREAIAKESRIKVMRGELVDLLLTNRHSQQPNARYEESRVIGAYIFADGKIKAVAARGVLLATGGFSQLYLHSTGPEASRGDGIAAAHRAGARTLDLEYVQFHPTALFVAGERPKLLTEALRGSGAKLLSAQGKSFVDEMAPRDVVSRAIHEELIRSGATHVWMDLRPVEKLAAKFPAIVQLLEKNRLDPATELIPVVPAAHYTLGGVWTDLEGRSSLPGLWAAGEAACTGLHGANRLASTSLLEGLVFGIRAAESAVGQLQSAPEDFVPREWIPESEAVDPALLQQDWQLLRQTLWNYIGLVRSERRLLRAEKILVELRREVESFYRSSALSHELLGLRNGVLVATLLLYSALRNAQSVGTHYLKEDY